jgi:hypothetical protein
VLEETDDEHRAVGELAAMFIRLGRAIATQGLPFVDVFYAVLCKAAGKDTVDALLGAMQDHHIPLWPGIADNSFDTCIHCAVAMVGVTSDEDHNQDCPVLTDVWPVNELDIMGELCCARCHEAFSFGEHYVSIPEILCLPCAAIGVPA